MNAPAKPKARFVGWAGLKWMRKNEHWATFSDGKRFHVVKIGITRSQ